MTPATSNVDPDLAAVRLAEAYGVESTFRDARGKEVVVSGTTSRRLLEAMGVDVDGALNSPEHSEWDAGMNALPPVVVARLQDDRCSIDIVLPFGIGPLAWTVTLETGDERSGTGDIARSPTASDRSGGAERCRLILRGLPLGYHRLSVPSLRAQTILIVAPQGCWLPADFNAGPGRWGIAVQLYLLRSGNNWGIGDFADLKLLVKLSAARGCDVIGLNPLHQMFLDDPEHASPYSPASRLYINALYISVPAVKEFGESDEAMTLVASDRFSTELEQVRSVTHVDYTKVTDLKLEALRLVFRCFASSASHVRKHAFEDFRRERGELLERTSVFLVLRQHLAGDDARLADWHEWPERYRDCRSDAVRRFADERRGEVEFLVWLQWVADEQLAEAAQAASDAGMTFRLYRDLAVGCDKRGAETWANPGAFLRGVQVGAPPDIFNPAGQDWGLPPFHPHALQGGGLHELHRAHQVEHAPCRRPAHRSRHGSPAPLLHSGWREAR